MEFRASGETRQELYDKINRLFHKGAKGQYFTPRHVIDMCVRMLHLQWEEYMIDTAAGSCGFMVHTIFHVWGGEMTSDGPTKDEADYASEMVYGLDFDARSVKRAVKITLVSIFVRLGKMVRQCWIIMVIW